MENLKAIIVFLLFWSIVIWCARIIKRKRDKQMMEFSEELPEMELVTDEEERKYICKNMVEMGKVENLFWGSVFLFNWWTIVRAIVEICREWSNGIAYELGDISNRYDALSQTFEPDFKSLLFGNLESFGAVGGGFTDILDLIINGGDLKSIIGLADTLCQTIGGFLEQRAKDVPDYLEVIRGEVKAEKKSMGKLLGKEIEEIRFSKAEKVSDKIKAGTKWGGMAFVGILNAVDNYEEFGTIHSKRFWEETLLETALDVIGGTLVSAIVGGLLAAAGISAAGIAIAAVTVGVMWAADVVYGYAQEAKGKESKRVTEAISDWVLDTAKQ